MNATDIPKAIPIAAPGEGTIATRVAAGLGLRPTRLAEWHFLRLAIVYVRQSDPQQVLNHLESRERQYALVDLAAALGRQFGVRTIRCQWTIRCQCIIIASLASSR